MDDKAPAANGLDLLRGGQGQHRRSPWGRRQARGHDRLPFNPARFGQTYAALDLGTNNCRLLVARATDDGFRVIDAFSRIIRLGEGVSTSGRISDAATQRALGALTVCRDKIVQRGAVRTRLIATEACRAAENGADFVARVRAATGLDLEVIDRETEARLAATGCTPLVDPAASGVILFDIGGGSSELVSMTSGPSASGPPLAVIRSWVSLPVGVVTLAERYGGIHVTPDLFEAMVGEVGRHVARFEADYRGAPVEQLHMLGTSGTVTTIAGVHLGLERYDRRHVDGCWMTDGEIATVLDRLLAMDYGARAANPCIGPERADLVLAGCAILEAIRRAFPCRRLRVADRGLREGMLVEMMRQDGVWSQRSAG